MHPCILLTKKHYVGISYETLGDRGIFDAKGIETVRRDGCLFVAKVKLLYNFLSFHFRN
jgi:DNA polymerase elongation subunit (family B)